MESTPSKLQKPMVSRKRKQESMDGSKKRHSSDNGGIDNLPDDVLINILSRTSVKEAGRASVLARRWRYLWMHAQRTFRFDNRDTTTGGLMERNMFESWVNTVVENHQARSIEGMAICFEPGKDECHPTSRTVDGWVNFAMHREVQRFEIKLTFKDRYEFPSLERLILLVSDDGVISSPFSQLVSLKLDHVDIKDHVVHYFLANCPNLEELCIHCSQDTWYLRVVDPPRLRVLEVHRTHRCLRLMILEVSATNLVSLSYGGSEKSLWLKNTPNLRELTISDEFCLSFVMDPEYHRSYSVQLEKLVLDFQLMKSKRFIVAPTELPWLCSLKRLEVRVFTAAGNNILFVVSLLEACPQLVEFKVQMFHSPYPTRIEPDREPFRIIMQQSRVVRRFRRNIKAVEIAGYIGCPNDNDLVREVMKIGRGSIERVVIDTQSAYYDDPLLGIHVARRRSFDQRYGYVTAQGASTRNEARNVARDLVSKFPRRIKTTVT